MKMHSPSLPLLFVFLCSTILVCKEASCYNSMRFDRSPEAYFKLRARRGIIEDATNFFEGIISSVVSAVRTGLSKLPIIGGIFEPTTEAPPTVEPPTPPPTQPPTPPPTEPPTPPPTEPPTPPPTEPPTPPPTQPPTEQTDEPETEEPDTDEPETGEPVTDEPEVDPTPSQMNMTGGD